MDEINLNLYVSEELKDNYLILKESIVSCIGDELNSNFDMSYNSNYDELNTKGVVSINIEKLSELFGEISEEDLYAIRDGLQEDQYGIIKDNINYYIEEVKPPGIEWINSTFDVSLKNNKIIIEIEITGYYFDPEAERNYYLDI